MTTSITSRLGRFIQGAWWLLDFSRRALMNLLLLVLVGALIWSFVRSGPLPIQDKTTLVLGLAGGISEQQSDASRQSTLRRLQGEESESMRLRDLLAVLEAASKDPQITQAVLMLDEFVGAGPATLREVAAAIERFKATGKPVTAWGSSFDQRQYFLAAHASQVWLHPMGSVLVEGYGRYRSYYKDLFDKLGVTAHVIRAGKFKNFAETFNASGPSPETLESDRLLYQTLWTSWTTGVEKARKQPTGSVMQAIDSLPDSLVAEGGNAARWALQRKWVDALKTREELRAALMEQGGATDDKKTFRQISYGQYLSRLQPQYTGDAVGVVVAEGTITDGRAGPGTVGGLSTAALIRSAREDDKIKALVLRVNSPGGSAFGSELVRRELELTRQAGKPVVVSMGDVAASGGYWISMAADEVLADEATITGSIGVVAVLPSAKAALDKLGVNTAGTTTTWLGGGFDPRRSLEPRFEKLIQATIDQAYRQFTTLTATARQRTPEQIDAVAQGRVWAGKDALAQGLVDRLGNYGDALKSAATRAKLPEGYRVEFIESPPGRWQMWLRRLGVNVDLQGWSQIFFSGPLLQPLGLGLGLLPAAAQPLVQDLGWLAEQAQNRKPFAATVHCLCAAP